jgi:hypothetical protein
MRNGIIVRKTPAHVEPTFLAACAFAFVETDAFVRNSLPAVEGPEYIPMIAGFLGSKTWEVKKKEASLLRAAGAKRLLCFPDLRNIKYGDRKAFRTEMALLDQETRGMEVFLYVAVDLLTSSELEEVTADIADTRFIAMAGIGEGKGTRATTSGDIVSLLAGKLGAERVGCAYWGEDDRKASASVLEQYGIQWVATLA